MRFSTLLAAVTLGQYAVSVNAAILAPNPTCQKNACLAAVVANRNPKNSKEWKPGCTSFFRKTITPSPATKTVTTGTLQTTTSTVTVTDVNTATITPVVTETATIHETSTVTTVVVTAAAQIQRRLDERDADGAPNKACPTTKAGPSKLPAYASACKNTVAYSSACSCVRVKHSTKKLPRCTTTKSVSRTGTVTATATSHVGASTTITVAARTTTITKTITDDVTATTTTTEGTTTITAAAGPLSVSINSQDGSLVNLQLGETTLPGSDLGILTGLTGGGTPLKVKLDKDGHLTTDGGDIIAGLLGGQTLRTLPALGGLLNGYGQPICQTSVSGGKDELLCDLGNGKNKFAYCTGIGSDLGKGLSLVAALPLLGDCKLVNVFLTDG